MTTKATNSVLNLSNPPISNIVALSGTLDGITLGNTTPGTGKFTTAAIESVEVNDVLVGQGASPIIGLSPGNANQVLISNGPGEQPSFSTFSIKTRLTQDTTFYVATNGNDSNPGTETYPWLTLTHAYTYLVDNIDAAGYVLTVQVANGTYIATGVENGTTAVLDAVGSIDGCPVVFFVGNPGNPGSVVLQANNCVCVSCNITGTILNINGFTLTASGTSQPYLDEGTGIVAYVGSIVYPNNINFGECSEYHMIGNGGQIILSPRLNPDGSVLYITYTISGSAITHMYGVYSGVVSNYSAIITISEPVSFSFGFATASNLGIILSDTNTFNGYDNVSGPKYLVETNAIIQTAGSGANYFPGTSPGSSNTGGQYA